MNSWLSDNVDLFSNEECRDLLIDLHCGQVCSPLQANYVRQEKKKNLFFLKKKKKIISVYFKIIFDYKNRHAELGHLHGKADTKRPLSQYRECQSPAFYLVHG